MSSLPAPLSTSIVIALLLVACSTSDQEPASSATAGSGGRAHSEGHSGATARDEDAAGASGADDGASAGAGANSSDAGAAGQRDPSDGAGASGGGVSGVSGASGAAGAGIAGAGTAGAGRGGSSGGGGGEETSGGNAGGAAAGALNTAGAGGNPNDGMMLPCAVNAAYGTCRGCHQSPPVNGAPFPLLTLQDHQLYKNLEIGDISSNTMPVGSTLSSADKSTLLDWLFAGAHGVPEAPCP